MVDSPKFDVRRVSARSYDGVSFPIIPPAGGEPFIQRMQRFISSSWLSGELVRNARDIELARELARKDLVADHIRLINKYATLSKCSEAEGFASMAGVVDLADHGITGPVEAVFFYGKGPQLRLVPKSVYSNADYEEWRITTLVSLVPVADRTLDVMYENPIRELSIEYGLEMVDL